MSLSPGQLLCVCHRCLPRGWRPDGQGRVACPGDGVDIVRHAESGHCPKGLYEAARLEAELGAAGYGPEHPQWPGNESCCGGAGSEVARAAADSQKTD